MDARTNFGNGTILTAPSPATSGTTMTLASGVGALMPAVPFNLVTWPVGASFPTAANAEIVRVTARTGDAITAMTRHAETWSGSAARTILAGWNVSAAITKKFADDIEAELALKGTVSSVGLTLPGILTVIGSPVTGSGTLAVSLATQAANLVLAGPASGAAAAPTFRSLVAADITGLASVPGGSTTQLQYNNAGVFGGIAGSAWDGATLAVPALQLTGVVTLAASASPLLHILDFSYTDTHIGLLNNGILYGNITMSPAGGVSIAKSGGIDLTYSTDPAYTGTITNANPFYVAFYGEGANDATFVTGSNADCENNGTGTWGNVSNYRAEIYNNGTVTGPWRGFWIRSFGNDGTIDTYEGVRIESFDGNIVNNYGLRIMSMAGVIGNTINHPINYADLFVVNSVGAVTAPALALSGTVAWSGLDAGTTLWTAQIPGSVTNGRAPYEAQISGNAVGGTWNPVLYTGYNASGTDATEPIMRQVIEGSYSGTGADNFEMYWEYFSTDRLTGTRPIFYAKTRDGATTEQLLLTSKVLNFVTAEAASSSLFARFQHSSGTTVLTIRRDGGFSSIGVNAAPTATASATIGGVVGTTALTVTGATQTTSFPVLDLSQTWNASGVTFTGQKFNVTRTASAGGSLFVDYQVDAASRLALVLGGFNGTSGGAFLVQSNNTNGAAISTGGLYLGLNTAINFGSNGLVATGTAVTPFDLMLSREAAAVLQMGTDVNGAAVAQTFKAHDGITGTNIAGANLTLAGGRGTGTGAPGNLIFQTAVQVASGTTAQTLGTRLQIIENKIGFFGATPVVQGASIADATGGAIIDAEARTALNALISRIEATGLIATV